MILSDRLKQQPLLFFLLIPLVSIGMHWRIFTTDLMGIHLWRQAQTQINIQNFYRHDFNIMNPRTNSFNGGRDNIQRFEFPIMQWLVACPHKIFGESIMITRISMFLIGLLGVLGMFFLFKWLWGNTTIALLGAWAFNFSPLFYYYTMNPLPDVFALTCTIWYMAFFFSYTKDKSWQYLLLSSLCLALASLAKLPFIIFGIMVGVYALLQLIKEKLKAIKEVFIVGVLFILMQLPSFFWYSWVIPNWGDNGVIKGAFANQVSHSEMMKIFNFHLYELLPYLLLNYLAIPIFLAGLFFMFKNKVFKRNNWIMLASVGFIVLVYYFFEYNMIGIVHDYYMVPFLVPLWVIVAYGIKELYRVHIVSRVILAVLLLVMPLFAFKQVDNYWSIEKSYINVDVMNNIEELRHAVPQNEICIILNDMSGFVLSYLVDKQGHIFKDDDLPMGWIEDMVHRLKVRYMYSDSKKINENPELTPFIDSLILDKGSMKVYRLKDLPPRAE